MMDDDTQLTLTENPDFEEADFRAPPGAAEAPDLSHFERSLQARTKVPLDRLDQYLGLSDQDLRQEVHGVARILKRFAEAVSASVEDPTSAGDFVRELDLRSVSRDHDWRAIFTELREHGGGYEGHKRAAIVKYLQYLSFRRKLLGFIYARRAGLEQTDEFSELALSAVGFDRSFRSPPGFEGEDAAAEGEGPEGRRPTHMRLPLGEPVEIRLPPDANVELMLAGHMFRLVGTRLPSLVDQNGVMYFLKEGRNVVGRHPESDISVDPNFRDVSRAHLIVEWSGGEELTLTDLSTRGTFIASSAVQRPAPPGRVPGRELVGSSAQRP